MSTDAAVGIGIGSAAALLLLAAALRSFMRVRTEVAMVKARLQDVWSVQPGEIKVDPEQCEACGQSSSGELLYRAEYRGMVSTTLRRRAAAPPSHFPEPPRSDGVLRGAGGRPA